VHPPISDLGEGQDQDASQVLLEEFLVHPYVRFSFLSM